MRRFETDDIVNIQLEEIFTYSSSAWGDNRAREYVAALIGTFREIAADRVPWRRIPAAWKVDGYVCKCGSHLIYWRHGADDVVRIVAILHQRMHQSARLRDMLDGEP